MASEFNGGVNLAPSTIRVAIDARPQ